MALETVPRTRRAGIALAAVTAVVSGCAIYLNGFGVRAWVGAGVSTTAYTTAKNLVAALALLGLAAVAVRRRRAGARAALIPPRDTWLRLGIIGIIGGAIPFVLFFEGLAVASSGQAALLHKTLLIWVALLAIPLLGERINGWHVAALGLLVAGQIEMAGGITDLALGRGELMILAAAVLWSVEVAVAKRVLATVPAATVGVARMGIGVIVLFGWLVVSGGFAGMAALSGSEWGWIVITGGSLTAYVATWYAALARAQAVDVTAVLVFGGVITALLRYGIDHAALPSAVGLGLVGAGAAVAAGAALRHGRGSGELSV
ncbi:MAG TPA: DMT family transporter [Acidimicrobiia bacterium]|jgi:MYXO-CTERM domain-containing protein|nr:DMT family transporter [Acidimicrobiia bacterium]